MPEPDRQPGRIAGDIAPIRVWQAVEEKMRLKICCDACGYEAIWTPLYMAKRFASVRGWTLFRLVEKLRCSGCRSQYIRIGRP